MSTGSASWAAARAEKLMPPLMAKMAALERTSATMLSFPATSLMSMVYSEIVESCHCCHADQASETLLKANVSGLWSVKVKTDVPPGNIGSAK